MIFHNLIQSERRRANIKTLTVDVAFAALLSIAIGAAIGIVWGMLS